LDELLAKSAKLPRKEDAAAEVLEYILLRAPFIFNEEVAWQSTTPLQPMICEQALGEFTGIRNVAGEGDVLSNFFQATILWNGVTFRSREEAYQSCKLTFARIGNYHDQGARVHLYTYRDRLREIAKGLELKGPRTTQYESGRNNPGSGRGDGATGGVTLGTPSLRGVDYQRSASLKRAAKLLLANEKRTVPLPFLDSWYTERHHLACVQGLHVVSAFLDKSYLIALLDPRIRGFSHILPHQAAGDRWQVSYPTILSTVRQMVLQLFYRVWAYTEVTTFYVSAAADAGRFPIGPAVSMAITPSVAQQLPFRWGQLIRGAMGFPAEDSLPYPARGSTEWHNLFALELPKTREAWEIRLRERGARLSRKEGITAGSSLNPILPKRGKRQVVQRKSGGPPPSHQDSTPHIEGWTRVPGEGSPQSDLREAEGEMKGTGAAPPVTRARVTRSSSREKLAEREAAFAAQLRNQQSPAIVAAAPSPTLASSSGPTGSLKRVESIPGEPLTTLASQRPSSSSTPLGLPSSDPPATPLGTPGPIDQSPPAASSPPSAPPTDPVEKGQEPLPQRPRPARQSKHSSPNTPTTAQPGPPSRKRLELVQGEGKGGGDNREEQEGKRGEEESQDSPAKGTGVDGSGGEQREEERREPENQGTKQDRDGEATREGGANAHPPTQTRSYPPPIKFVIPLEDQPLDPPRLITPPTDHPPLSQPGLHLSPTPPSPSGGVEPRKEEQRTAGTGGGAGTSVELTGGEASKTPRTKKRQGRMSLRREGLTPSSSASPSRVKGKRDRDSGDSDLEDFTGTPAKLPRSGPTGNIPPSSSSPSLTPGSTTRGAKQQPGAGPHLDSPAGKPSTGSVKRKNPGTDQAGDITPPRNNVAGAAPVLKPGLVQLTPTPKRNRLSKSTRSKSKPGNTGGGATGEGKDQPPVADRRVTRSVEVDIESKAPVHKKHRRSASLATTVPPTRGTLTARGLTTPLSGAPNTSASTADLDRAGLEERKGLGNRSSSLDTPKGAGGLSDRPERFFTPTGGESSSRPPGGTPSSSRGKIARPEKPSLATTTTSPSRDQSPQRSPTPPLVHTISSSTSSLDSDSSPRKALD
jgi:hypothetical protein